MPLNDWFSSVDVGDDDSPLTRELLEGCEALLDRLQPALLDVTRSAIQPGVEGLDIELRHRTDPDLRVDITGFGEEVVVSYGEEHEHFDVEHEFVDFAVGPFAVDQMVPRVISFLEALLTGRVELHVTHRLFWVSTISYWINDAGTRERFLRGGTVLPTFRWTREPIVRVFDFR